MSQLTPNHTGADVPWPTSDHRMPVPDTSMLPGTEAAPPAAVNLVQQAAQGLHAGIDRLADRATPVARELGERVAAAEDTLHAKADQLRDTRDAWVDEVRAKVRKHPLASVAAAATVGAVLARITR